MFFGPGGPSGPDDDKPTKLWDREILGRLWAYVRPHWKRLAWVLGMMLATRAALLAQPVLWHLLLDVALPHRDWILLYEVAAGYVGLALISTALAYPQEMMLQTLGAQVIADLRNDLFAHLQRLSLDFYDRREAGQIISRVTNDIDAMSEILNFGVMTFLGDLLVLAGSLAVMVRMSPRLTLWMLVLLPILIGISWWFRRRAKKVFDAVQKEAAAVTSAFQENLSGVRVVQSFVREDENFRRFAAISEGWLEANLNAVRLFSQFFPTLEALRGIANAGLLLFGGLLVLGHRLELGVLIAFQRYFEMFFMPVRNLTRLYGQLQRAMIGAERVFEILDTPPRIQNAPGAIKLPDEPADIRFENVSFAYEEGQEVLHEVSFTVQAGQRIALVGPTGAGKTTLLNLLMRLYDPQQGRITLDGRDLREITVESLRNQMAIVLQDSFLFSGSVRDNICYGRRNATPEEIEAAARAVHAHDFISQLPQGYDTQVKERGGRFSAGQRQLISFARALLANPRILLLDEATSDVDTMTETQIQTALHHLLHGRTAIIIAHRLSTVANADRILVINEGRIVEEGTHSELLAQGGLYRRLYEMQFRDVEEEPETA